MILQSRGFFYVTRHIKYFISSLALNVWPQKIGRWWLSIMGFHPYNHLALCVKSKTLCLHYHNALFGMSHSKYFIKSNSLSLDVIYMVIYFRSNGITDRLNITVITFGCCMENRLDHTIINRESYRFSYPFSSHFSPFFGNDILT